MMPADDVSPEAEAEIRALLARANTLAERHLESPTLSENAPIRVWRQAYQQFKTKRGARCSIENLLKRVLKGNPVGPISPSVDLYNAMSLKYALPFGGEDIDAFAGDLRLAVTQGGDAFLPLGEGAENDPTLRGSSPTSTTRARSAAAGIGATACAPRSPTPRATPSSSWNASIPTASRTAGRRPMSSRSSSRRTSARPLRSRSSITADRREVVIEA